MHYYQHHIGDFIKDTANLDDHQLATYLRMIWSYYSSEKLIPLDVEDVAFAMRSDVKTVRLLLRHFFKETENGWSHSRCDREIEEYRIKGEKARNSANARWNNANALRKHSEGKANATIFDANQEPITKNHKPMFIRPSIDDLKKHILEKGLNVDAEKFFAFYESNGWKVGKNAMKNWQMALVTWNKSSDIQQPVKTRKVIGQI